MKLDPNKVLALWTGKRIDKIDSEVRKLLKTGYYDYVMFLDGPEKHKLLHWLRIYDVIPLEVPTYSNGYLAMVENCTDHVFSGLTKKLTQFYTDVLKTNGIVPLVKDKLQDKLLEIREAKKKAIKGTGVLSEGNTHRVPRIRVIKTRRSPDAS